MSQVQTLLNDFWTKRLSQFSTVAVFRTSDPKRLEPFIKFLHANYEKLVLKKSISSYEIFLFRVWSGLYRVRITSERVEYEPVSSTMAPSPLAIQLPQQQQAIRDLTTALQYIDNLMNQREGIVFILCGLFPKKGSQSEYDNLVAFVRNAVFTDSYYVRFHTIIMFSEAPELIIDEDTLKHCIFINLPPSFDEERKQIIENIANSLMIPTNGVDALVEATKGLNLHETESIVLESFFKQRKLDPQVIVTYKYDIVRKTGLLDIEEPRYGFEAVGGYSIVKRFILDNVVNVIRNPKKAEKLGLRPPRGILLFGPPGTGKTLFARALAKELGLPFLRLRTEKIVSKWYGETSRNIARAIEIAESIAPCVLFIDEIDRFGRRGGITEHEESRRAFSILLEWLGDDRRKTIVVGTTNRPEDLDEAFRRVGRFDYMIPFLYPDYEARLEILKVHTSVVRRVPLASDVDLNKIAIRTELWTGAELEELVLRAARNALREDSDIVAMKHFETALATFRVNQDERKRQLDYYLELAREFTNDAEFLESIEKTYTSRVEAVKQLLDH